MAIKYFCDKCNKETAKYIMDGDTRNITCLDCVPKETEVKTKVKKKLLTEPK